MATLFHDIMHKQIEVYVDNLIETYREKKNRLVNLCILVDRLGIFILIMSKTKSTFGVTSGKIWDS